eukprot:TRINITY_DN2574_c0_g1_i1.p2 TRINITY_DN2574_c0_g1~~TRINITY_DN2574_c0_g1_i1.p2  ORF type:complete len:364 (-),score=53.46 TRINITY_DN2574_c0_g1_i1:1259-2257(-)
MTDQKSKLEYLKKKYFGASKSAKNKQTSDSTVENPKFAPSLDIFADKDPDLPIIIEDPEGLLKTNKHKHGVNKSNWITLEEGKADLEPPRKKRHDSDSEEEQPNNPVIESLKIDESGDIEPPRPKGRKLDRGIIEEVTERERARMLQEPTQTVYREKGGRIISKEKAQTAKKEELERLNYEQLNKWGKGTKQLQQEKERAAYEAKVAKEPLRNTELTEEADEALKGIARFGDPMKDFIEQRKSAEPGLVTFKSKFKAPPNRYGIEPGHRWDGVDRGNGFEKKLLGARNERIANEADAYKWRTEEMQAPSLLLLILLLLIWVYNTMINDLSWY